MKKHFLILLFSITLICIERSAIHAQQTYWVDHIGGQETDQAWGGQCDREGNYYLSGTLFGSCYFPPDIVLGCSGYNDTFLAKFNASGEGLWALRLGGYNPETYGEYMSIYYDSVSEHLYLAGHFYGGVTFGSFYFETQYHDIIIAKYTLDGSCVWARKYGGEGSDLCYALTVDGSGNIYICGKNYDSIDFGSDTISKGGFIAKFDPEGNCIWAKQKFPFEVIIQSGLIMQGITASDSTILFSGDLHCKDVFTIDTIPINHPGYGSSLIVFFNKDGTAIRVKEGIAESISISASLATDQAGNIFLTGGFLDVITFDTTHLKTKTSNSDMFFAKYNNDGILQWAKQADADWASGEGVYSDGEGYTYVAGDFSGNAAFGGQNVTSHSQEDAFIARYDPAGQCLGVMHWGNCAATGITEDPDSYPVVALKFRLPCTLDDSTYISRGDLDILVLKTSPINSTKETPAGPDNTLFIYANPTTGRCNITIPEEFRHEENLILYIYDTQGKLIQQASLEQTAGETYRLDIRAQAAGIYQAVLSDGKKKYTGKIVFEKRN